MFPPSPTSENAVYTLLSLVQSSSPEIWPANAKHRSRQTRLNMSLAELERFPVHSAGEKRRNHDVVTLSSIISAFPLST
jgi:hypothetical protein